MRTKIEVHAVTFRGVVATCDASGSFTNRHALYTEIAAQYNKKIQPPLKEITPSIVALRIKDWGIILKTPMGKKGRTTGFSGGGKRTSKKEKFSTPHIQAFFKQLKQRTPTQYHGLVDRAANGSRTAGQKLHCLECSGWSSGELAKCNIVCSLWPFRQSALRQLGKPQEELQEQKEAA
jgi:hypothetical protein